MNQLKAPALATALLLIAACGGEDGDTIIQGGNDKQAREDIATLQAEVESAQTSIDALELADSSLDSRLTAVEVDAADNSVAIADIEDSVAGLGADVAEIQQLKPHAIYDESGRIIGRIIGISYGSADWKLDTRFLAQSPTGFLFQYNTYLQNIELQDLYFVESGCSGQAYLPNISQASPGYSKGIVFRGGDDEGPGTYYLDKNTPDTVITPLSQYDGNGDICNNGAFSDRPARPVYRDEAETTGLPAYIPGPLDFK